jgi:hypothetical protein
LRNKTFHADTPDLRSAAAHPRLPHL